MGRPLKTFGTASLDIQWPKEISNGKWLLYLMKIDSKGLEKVSCQPENEINSLHVAVCSHVIVGIRACLQKGIYFCFVGVWGGVGVSSAAQKHTT